MENPESNLFDEIENALNSAKNASERKSLQAQFLSIFLVISKNIPKGPISLAEMLNKPPLPTEDEFDNYARRIFSLLPENVVEITYPNGQQVSRELEIPKEEKKRWTLKDIDNYRINLLNEIGKPSEPIIK